MSVRMMTLVWALNLPDSEKLVLLALADCANDEGYCWPGMKTLVAKCSKSDRTIQTCIKSLEAAGHLTRDEDQGKGCSYVVHPRRDFAPEEISGHPRKGCGTPPKRFRGNHNRTIKEPSPPKGAHELPANWEPLELTLGTQARKVVDNWPPGEFEAQVEQFRAHHLKTGSKWKDWQQAWITWVLNTRKFGIGKHERNDPTLDALQRFQSLCGDVGSGAGTGEEPQTGGPDFHGLGRSTGVARIGGGRA